MKSIENYIPNAGLIVSCAQRRHHLFEPREGDAAHGSVFPFMSKFSTLRVKPDDYELIDLIFSEQAKWPAHLRSLYDFIQIQWYKPGDYIVPHKDNYDVTKLHLVTLTTSVVDGLVVQDGDNLVRVLDTAGTKIDFDYQAWHWVDPVVSTRYSLVIGE